MAMRIDWRNEIGNKWKYTSGDCEMIILITDVECDPSLGRAAQYEVSYDVVQMIRGEDGIPCFRSDSEFVDGLERV